VKLEGLPLCIPVELLYKPQGTQVITFHQLMAIGIHYLC